MSGARPGCHAGSAALEVELPPFAGDFNDDRLTLDFHTTNPDAPGRTVDIMLFSCRESLEVDYREGVLRRARKAVEHERHFD